jgi:carbonic anhydrase
MPRHDLRYNAADADQNRPATSQEAREALLDGNRRFADWITSCRAAVHEQGADAAADQVDDLVLSCGGLPSILSFASHEYPAQNPFAVVVGCSDARVPMEMVFGQGYNDLFVIRNAGNVISAVLSGSVDFTLTALADCVHAIVVLGHTGCGAVKGAVDAYLDPSQYWSKSVSPNLRIILQRIFIAVRESDRAIREVWGPGAASRPEYRDALMESAICLNAAYSAFELRQQVETASGENIDVFHAVYDVRSHLVRTPPRLDCPAPEGRQDLTLAAKDPEELTALAREIARALNPA